MITTTTSNAVDRYRYLLRTANPDQIEQAHEQAFAQMTPAERQEVLRALSATDEVPVDASASALARSATRLEVRQPGRFQQLLGGNASLGTTLVASLAAGFVGSAVWSTLTGGDGFGGRPGLLCRLFGFDHRGFGGVDRMAGGMMGGPMEEGPMGGGDFGGGGPGF